MNEKVTPEDQERLKEQLFSAYLAHAPGREKLIQSILRPCEELLLHAKEDPTVFAGVASEFGVRVNTMVRLLDRITHALDGSENYPKKEFEKVSTDLKALQSALPSDTL